MAQISCRARSAAELDGCVQLVEILQAVVAGLQRHLNINVAAPLQTFGTRLSELVRLDSRQTPCYDYEELLFRLDKHLQSVLPDSLPAFTAAKRLACMLVLQQVLEFSDSETRSAAVAAYSSATYSSTNHLNPSPLASSVPVFAMPLPAEPPEETVEDVLDDWKLFFKLPPVAVDELQQLLELLKQSKGSSFTKITKTIVEKLCKELQEQTDSLASVNGTTGNIGSASASNSNDEVIDSSSVSFSHHRLLRTMLKRELYAQADTGPHFDGDDSDDDDGGNEHNGSRQQASAATAAATSNGNDADANGSTSSSAIKLNGSQLPPLWPHQALVLDKLQQPGIKNMIIVSGTGTGKTRMFVEWSLHMLRKTQFEGRVLVLVPTSDLPAQHKRQYVAAGLPEGAVRTFGGGKKPAQMDAGQWDRYISNPYSWLRHIGHVPSSCKYECMLYAAESQQHESP